MKTYESTEYGIKVAEAIKALRKQKDMTQMELQEKANLSSGYISRLEAGEYAAPSIVHILKIAHGFDMNLRDFLECADLIPQESTFESCLRGEGMDEEQIKKITDYKNYVLYSNKDGK